MPFADAVRCLFFFADFSRKREKGACFLCLTRLFLGLVQS